MDSFNMKNITITALTLIALMHLPRFSYAQCSRIGDNGSDQITTGACAPVGLQMPISYEFDFPVSDPSKVKILYNWGDGSPDTIVSPSWNGTNTLFQDTISHQYPLTGDECSYTAYAYVVYDGEHCTSSAQLQSFRSWNVDNENGGEITTDPVVSQYCEGDPIFDIFDDASTFNCNINIEHDKPNQEPRWVQFIYGTQAAGGDRIPNIEVEDNNGIVHQMTDALGASVAPLSGPIIMIPFEANGPNQSSFPISAPPGGVAGDIFEITLRNWNICNPYDNDPYDGIPPADPVNGDNPPITTTAYIEIITTPPLVQNVTKEYCTGDNIIIHVGGNNIKWYSDSLLNNLIFEGSNFKPLQSPVNLDNSVPGHYTFWITDAIDMCESAPNKVDIIIYESPTNADAGDNFAVCESFTTLTGNTPAVGTGFWTTSSSALIADSTNPTSAVTNLELGNNRFTWHINNGICTSSDDLTISRDEAPDTAYAGSDQAVCHISTINMAADAPTKNGVGSWQIMQGTGNIVDPTNENTVITNLGAGENIFTWTVSSKNSGCPSTADSVKIIRDLQPDSANAGPDREFCDLTSVPLQANAVTNSGTGLWSIISGTGIPDQLDDPGTNLLNITAGSHTLAWKIESELGICPVTRDSVTYTMHITPNQAMTGPDQELCLVHETDSLEGNLPNVGTGTWSVISKPLGASPSFLPNDNTPNAIAQINTGEEGEYAFAWTIANGICATRDTITIDFGQPPSPADAGPDKAICGRSLQLDAVQPDTGKGTWTVISGPGIVTLIPDEHDPKAFAEINSGDEETYTLEWRITSGSCPIGPHNTDTAEITFNLVPNAPVTQDIFLCGADSGTLHIITGQNGTENRWYTDSVIPVIMQVSDSLHLPVIGNTTSYWVSTYNSFSQCESPRIKVTAHVNPIPDPVNPTDMEYCGAGTFSLQVPLSANSNTIRWYTDTLLNPIYTGMDYTTYIDTTTLFFVSGYDSITGCEGSKMPMQITIHAVPEIPAVQDTAYCGAHSFTLEAFPGLHTTEMRWYEDAGLSNLLTSDNTYITNTLTSDATFYVTGYNSTTNCESAPAPVHVTINPIPAEPVAPNVINCGADTLVMTAIPGNNGNITRWYETIQLTNLLAEDTVYEEFVATNTSWYVTSIDSLTGCESQPTQQSALIQDIPLTTPIQGTTQVGLGQSNVIYMVDYHTGSSYTWNIPPEITVLMENKNVVVLEFNQEGLFTIEVQEDAPNGCPAEPQEKTILVEETVLSISIEAPAGEGCTGTDIQLGTSVTGGTPAYSYQWYGDTSSLSSTTISNPVFYSTTPGTFNFEVHVTDVNQNEGLMDVEIIVNPSPQVDITAPGTQVCGGLDVPIRANVSGGSGNYTIGLWGGNTAGLSAANITNPTFNSKLQGTFAMNYTVIDDKGCTDTDTLILENKYPMVQFSSDAIPGCSPVEVTFKNESNHNIFTWDFNDGNTSDKVSPTHIFYNTSSAVEYFEVLLTATDTFGCEATKKDFVTVYPNPEHVISLEPDTACSPYNAIISATPGGFQYQWNFGDGDYLNGGYNALHTFRNETSIDTTYQIELVTTSFFGCKDTVSHNVLIHPSPTAKFEASPKEQMYPDATVYLKNMSSIGNWDYLWDFGDHKNTTQRDPVTHTYADRGSYTIRLYVSSEHCTDSAIQAIKIVPHPPIAEFNPVAPGCMPLTINFENKSAHSNTYLWEFGDGSISNKPNPNYTYYEPGKYKIKLTAVGAGGTDVHAQVNDVWVLPNSFFDLAPKFVYVNDEAVNYFNLSDHGDTYLWNFGDGNTSTEFNPKHVYKEEGVFDVTLQVWTANNCFDLYEMKNAVVVRPSGKVIYPNVFSPLSQIEENRKFYPGIIDNVLEYHLMVFNRWGDLVFETYDQEEGWNGYYKGSPAKSDVYVFKVTGKYTDGQTFVKTGDVTLLY